MEETKNLCAHIPVSLHDKVRAEQEQTRLNLSQYVTQIITEYYERGEMRTMDNTRTLAIQISDDLFERLKAHLKTVGKSQKRFIVELIEKALAEASV